MIITKKKKKLILVCPKIGKIYYFVREMKKVVCVVFWTHLPLSIMFYLLIVKSKSYFVKLKIHKYILKLSKK